MEKLLPYFERELGMLRRAGQEFAARYPMLAGSLGICGDNCADPLVERLLQGTAFISARNAKLLDDGHKGLTEALLGILYPHYLRPFPACSIARIDYRAARANEIAAVSVLPRGTGMKSRGQDGVACRFRTVYDVAVAPLAISALRFDPIIEAPAAVRLPDGVTSAICIEITGTSVSVGLAMPELQALRVFIDGEAALRAALRDALFLRAACAFVEADGEWRLLDKIPLAAVGFADSDALLPAAPSEHAAYRLLSEYFAFPEKFDFIDIDLTALLRHAPPGCRKLTLTVGLSGPVQGSGQGQDGPAARLLRMLSPDNLALGCTPIVNLFQHAATPIRVTHARSSYPLLPDAMPAAACEVYSVDAVQLLSKSAGGGAVTEFTPYYALGHANVHSQAHGQAQGHAPGRQGLSHGRYWLARRDEELAAMGNAHEFSLSLVDRDLSALKLEAGTASVRLTCTNRNLPQALRHGHPAGDLSCETAPGGFPIRLLRRPTASQRIASDHGAHWGLIAHLALNHRSLTQEGLPALAAMLRLYARQDSAVAQRQIAGISGLTHRAATTWLRRPDGAAYLRGVEISVTLDQEAFAGSGVHVFAQLLDHFVGLHVHLNSFTQPVVLCKASGKELLRCPPRNGMLALV